MDSPALASFKAKDSLQRFITNLQDLQDPSGGKAHSLRDFPGTRQEKV